MSASNTVVIRICALLLLTLGPGAVTAQKKGDQNPAQPLPAPATPFSEVRRDSLLNGMQIVTLERPAERIKCELIVRSGAMFDTVGKAGLASLTQATLMAANPRIQDEIESLQGEVTWGLDWDATWYRLEVPAGNFETALEILSRLVNVEAIRTDAFKRAQELQLDRAKERAKQEPGARADEAFLAALYREHPYGHGIDGDEQTIATIKQGDIHDFESRFYLANNAVALVVGPIRHERVVRAFKLLFGGWVKGPVVPPTFRQPQRTTEVRVVRVVAPEASKVELRGGVVGLKATDEDFVVGQVVARVLEARLKRDAAAQQADRVMADAPSRRLAGPIYFSASITPERAVAFSRAATDGFAALAGSPITAEELASAKASLASERGGRSVGDHLREIEFYALPRTYPLTYMTRLEAVTAADVQRVVQRLLAANALTVVVLGPVSENLKPQM
jgi:zinc protease